MSGTSATARDHTGGRWSACSTHPRSRRRTRAWPSRPRRAARRPHAPAHARRLRRPGAPARRGLGAAHALESGEPHSMVLFGPPGTGKTTLARLAAEHADAAFEELSAVNAGRAEVRAVIERARQRRADRPPHDLLPRRDPPLQQGPAGRAAARGRGGAGDADRRHHREPVLRGQQRAALARAGLRAARADDAEQVEGLLRARSTPASAATARSPTTARRSSPRAPAATPAPR